MINRELLDPKSIVVVGGSNNKHKPGGKILANIIEGNYRGELRVINPREDLIQGVKCFSDHKKMPPTELAILAIPAGYCVDTVKNLAAECNTRAFIILSAGFGEESVEGALIEKDLLNIANQYQCSLIGPNCIGVLTGKYHGIFTSPIPRIDEYGCDLISGSGATAVFIMESGIPKGLTFSSVFSVGNSTQNGIEEVLEYLDEHFYEHHSKVKLLYIESIRDPDKLLKHSASLIRKGCKIAAIKAGMSDEGKRAALSHTGAITSSDAAVDALFRKAGIIRCYGREELTTVALVLMLKELKGKQIAIITHAGGPAVMLTDALSQGGLGIPKIEGKEANELLDQLHPGASVNNPIDLLATGTAEQLGKVIDYCDTRFNNIDAMMVIFGSPGLTNVFDAYDVLHKKIKECKKPIFPVLPSLITAKEEVDFFISQGHCNFPDEVQLGSAIVKVYNNPEPATEQIIYEGVDLKTCRKIIDRNPEGFMNIVDTSLLLNSTGIPFVESQLVRSRRSLLDTARKVGFPLVMKIVGPLHKSDIQGVVLNINTERHLLAEYLRLKKLKEFQGVVLQPMISGLELFIGAKYEPRFGHVMLVGLGGIFVEVLKDVASGMAPLTFPEAYSMIHSLKSYEIIHGTRGKNGVNEQLLAQCLVRLSTLLRFSTDIVELDINPLIGNPDSMTAVDARIKIQRKPEANV